MGSQRPAGGSAREPAQARSNLPASGTKIELSRLSKLKKVPWSKARVAPTEAGGKGLRRASRCAFGKAVNANSASRRHSSFVLQLSPSQAQVGSSEIMPALTSPDLTTPLSEAAVVKGFHSILKDSLAQARGEGLVTDEELETGDVDVQIAGPALALFFAALGSTGTPPTIAAPDGSFALTSANCPPSFRSFFTLWQTSVAAVQHLSSSSRFDLALLLCDKEPQSSPLRPDVVKLSGNLKAVAIEITQRRTFQERYAADLQAALDSQVKPRRSDEGPRSAGFVPPPEYEEIKGRPDEQWEKPVPPPRNQPTISTRPMPEQQLPQEMMDNLAVIRETLYSALADCIVESPSILSLLSRGPQWASRAFFTSTSLAILEVALTRVNHMGVRVVHMGRSSPRTIGPQDTPPYLRSFLSKLMEVADAAKAMSEEDDERAMREAAEGDVTTEPRLGRLRERLERGAGEGDEDGRRASVEGSVATLANAIGELAIGMASLPSFQERQAEVFKILAAITSF
ncbi:hypothetical protein P7C70_g4093, partial [Phenoliferia sp. Uapishka_3]